MNKLVHFSAVALLSTGLLYADKAEDAKRLDRAATVLKEILAAPPRIPAKVETWTGDPDYLPWFAIQRSEFDNTNELIALLERGGLEMIAKAQTPRYEDTFLLGPDVEGALKRKAQLMREHWLDAQRYLASPHK